ncbi:hypothetical protein QUB63_28935 [Microcoleus sp. ARI1-B5]|uniref:hypothetical protein n=1 Tax=unclassified Microcoleus TaxID=2642155 RepID=UPI002FD13FA6
MFERDRPARLLICSEISGSESCDSIDRAFELYLIHDKRSPPPAFCRGSGAVALGTVKDAISLKSQYKT